MIRAYNELYLNDAQILLANAFDYALNDCRIDVDQFAFIFSSSKITKEYENGNPSVVSGMSAQDFVIELMSCVAPHMQFPEVTYSYFRSPAYWTGWALAYYQWFTAKSFQDIFRRVALSDIISMYGLYHEMDISIFVEDLNKKYESVVLDTNLKRIRMARGLSQSQLARLSAVKLRSIQLYEKRVNDIDKAQGHTLYRLARVLGCEIEDLLENPENME